MSAKEKANQLISAFVTINISQVNDLVDGIRIRLAKECALILAEEMIKEHTWKNSNSFEKAQLKKWQEIKSEIQSF